MTALPLCSTSSALAPVVMVGLVPVRELLSVAVTAQSVPTVVPVVNVTVATPSASVVLVPEPNDPPVPVLLQVTTTPAEWIGSLLALASCAVIVTSVPATGA